MRSKKKDIVNPYIHFYHCCCFRVCQYLVRFVAMQVVFQITSGEQDVQLSMLGQLNNLLHEAEAGKKSIAVEVVVHGQAWNLLLPNGNPLSGKVQSLQERCVKFLVCQNTLNGRQLQVEQLLPRIEVVPAAIYHLVKRQQVDGWAYIRC